MPEQTAVAMSGGVDSSAAAWLLRQEGRPLVGFTLQLFPPRAGEDPALDAGQVARAMGFPHHTVEMAQTFREEMGLTPGQYMDEQVFLQAEQLLRRTDLSIQQISDLLGFCDPCYFSRRFHKRYGLSPKQYRKNSLI